MSNPSLAGFRSKQASRLAPVLDLASPLGARRKSERQRQIKRQRNKEKETDEMQEATRIYGIVREFRQILVFGKPDDCLPSSLYIEGVLPVRTSLLIWTFQEQHTRCHPSCITIQCTSPR